MSFKKSPFMCVLTFGLLLGLLTASSASALGGVSISPMRDISDDSRIRLAFSVLKRFEDRVEVTVTTRAPGNNAHTFWVIIFNNPAACATDPCTLNDFGAPGTDSAFFWGTGRVAPPGGLLVFQTPIFEGPPPGQNIFGNGLTNPEGAQFQFILRNHGEQIPSALGDQLTNVNGGCPPNTCMDIQITRHPDH